MLQWRQGKENKLKGGYRYWYTKGGKNKFEVLVLKRLRLNTLGKKQVSDKIYYIVGLRNGKRIYLAKSLGIKKAEAKAQAFKNKVNRGD